MKSDDPLISIAMCTYNGERFLREQMDSLIAQDYPNLEIVIVDDGSSDGTMNILHEYAEKYPHIRLYQNKTNLGYTKNFEKAISLCRGKYISLCDQDDIWFPEKTRILYENIGEFSLIYSKPEIIDESGEKIDREFPRTNRLTGKCSLGLLFKNCIVGHLSLFSAKLCEKILPIPSGISHDHWIGFAAAEENGILAHDRVLSLYRLHDNNTIFGSRKQKRLKAIKRWKRYKKRLLKLEILFRYNHITPEIKETLKEVLRLYKRYRYTFVNKKFRKFLREHKEIVSISKKPEKMMKNLSRGFLRDIF